MNNSILTDSQRILPGKGKVSLNRKANAKIRAKQKGRRFDEGEFAGLEILELQSGVLKGVWIIHFNGLIIASYKVFPAQIWKKLSAQNRSSVPHFEPLSETEQLRREANAKEFYRMVEYWETAKGMKMSGKNS